MKRAFGAALVVGCVLVFANACGGEDERNYRSMRKDNAPKGSGDAEGQTPDGTNPSPNDPNGGSNTTPGGSTPPPNTKPSQLDWDGAETRGDSDFSVIVTE